MGAGDAAVLHLRWRHDQCAVHHADGPGAVPDRVPPNIGSPADFDDRPDGVLVGPPRLCGLFLRECQSRLGRAHDRSTPTTGFQGVERRGVGPAVLSGTKGITSLATTDTTPAPADV